ncbi:hypothetical protein [Kitasatospora sp. GP82]|uniref:hypothetical protein n=1 Tax=Kitasatospora sp. GP82 TaxID=3035089 RepID=UPI00247655C0|nr:hypothetical protein [Kitasatospora sp. GP82]MDH6130003.1 hypothetical protein [Kitasatospora sp. GP82]
MTVVEETRPEETAAERGDTTPGAGAEQGGPVWMLRINPLRRHRLADPELADLLGELTRQEGDLRRLGAVCGDALYTRIAEVSGSERGALVALRRAIHNDRVPASLPADPLPEVLRWVELRARREALRSDIARRYPLALERERRFLTRLLGDEDLLRSLALIAPEVYEAAVRYQEGATARARKSERGLLQYTTRAMMRTSPLSRFTAVGLAVPASDGIAVEDVPFPGARALVDLDRVILSHVVDGLSAEHGGEACGPDTWVRQPPTLAQGPDRNRLYFTATTADGTKRLSVPLSEPVRQLLELTAMGPRRVGAVVDDLARLLGAAQEQAHRLVASAMRTGFLCAAAGPEDCAEDLLGSSPDRAPAAADDFTGLSRRLARLATLPHEQRVPELRAVHEVTGAMSHTARRPAKITIAEDYVVPPIRLATEGYQRQLRDLAGTVEFLSVFDRLHDVRAILTDVFVERFGRGGSAPLAEHARPLVRAVYERESAGVDSLTGLRALRTRMLGVLRAELDTRDPGAAEVVWPVAELAALAADMPERFRQDPLSYGVLVQPADGRLVINDAYAGHGMLYGRFLGPDAEAGGTARSRLRQRLLRQYGSDGARVVEDRGLHRLNVNAHIPVLDDGLYAEDWYRLRLVHDGDLDRLHIEDDEGRRLRVLTLGTGHPELYPAPLRIANWLVSGGRLRPDLGLSGGLTGADAAGTAAVPSLCAGSVVLQRRRWYGGEEFERAAGQGPDDTDRLLALTRWRARHGVPAEVLLKPVTDWEARRAVATGGGPREHDKQRKPQYMDLTSALLTRALPRFLDRGASSYLEEALPGAAQSPHAFEWVVEISRPSGGHFGYEKEIACV